MKRLRLVFAGTPDFALPALDTLIGAGHEIACVYTQPPRAAGRGQKPKPSPVQRRAEEAGLKLRTPESLDARGEIRAFGEIEADAGVVVAYGIILPPEILSSPRLGLLNAHASLLPRWRGAAPIERAIMAGDEETGMTIMVIDQALDAGPTLIARRVPIGPDATTGSLRDELARLAGPLLLDALDGLDSGRLTPEPQAREGVTHAPKLSKEEGRIDWRREPEEIDRQVRAFHPAPGAYFEHEEVRIKLLSARPVGARAGAAEGRARPGEVLDGELAVACGAKGGALRLLELQRAGRRPASAQEFSRGFPIPPGTELSWPCPATS